MGYMHLYIPSVPFLLHTPSAEFAGSGSVSYFAVVSLACGKNVLYATATVAPAIHWSTLLPYLPYVAHRHVDTQACRNMASRMPTAFLLL